MQRFGGLPTVLVVTVGLTWAPFVVAQPATTASCEQQVEEHYKQLSADTIMPQVVPQAPDPAWRTYLTGIVTEFRTRDNQFKLKQNQAQFAEERWLRALAEQRMRSPAPPAAAPAN